MNETGGYWTTLAEVFQPRATPIATAATGAVLKSEGALL
jgi:hypothetical protein